MALKFHPEPGTILMCDFQNFRQPEMVKIRPVVVVSPRMKRCSGLCTVVAISTQEPSIREQYHLPIEPHLMPPLPKFQAKPSWLKGDMIYRVSFDRLNLIQLDKDLVTGRRNYFKDVIDRQTMNMVYGCIMSSLNLGHLRQHL